MNDRNAKTRYPSFLRAIDKTFYPYYERIGFKQHNLINQQNMVY